MPATVETITATLNFSANPLASESEFITTQTIEATLSEALVEPEEVVASSSDEDVATVGTPVVDGTDVTVAVTPVAPGTTTVTVAVGASEQECTVTVGYDVVSRGDLADTQLHQKAYPSGAEIHRISNVGTVRTDHK